MRSSAWLNSRKFFCTSLHRTAFFVMKIWCMWSYICPSGCCSAQHSDWSVPEAPSAASDSVSSSFSELRSAKMSEYLLQVVFIEFFTKDLPYWPSWTPTPVFLESLLRVIFVIFYLPAFWLCSTTILISARLDLERALAPYPFILFDVMRWMLAFDCDITYCIKTVFWEWIFGEYFYLKHFLADIKF